MSTPLDCGEGRVIHLPMLLSVAFGISTSEARRGLGQGAVHVGTSPETRLDVPAAELAFRTLRYGRRRSVLLNGDGDLGSQPPATYQPPVFATAREDPRPPIDKGWGRQVMLKHINIDHKFIVIDNDDLWFEDIYPDDQGHLHIRIGGTE